jgi:hypothetical protein
VRINDRESAVAPALVVTEADIEEPCDLVGKSLAEGVREVGP